MAYSRTARAQAVADASITFAVGQLDLSGELDAVCGLSLLESVERELGRGHELLYVDLTRVTYCNVEGFRALLCAARRVNGSGGRLVLCHPCRLVRLMAEVAGSADELGL
jgi:anti-anti-sigma factor